MDKSETISVIDVVRNLGQYHTIPVSRFVTELEYIPLETSAVCLVGEVNKDYFITATTTHIFVSGIVGTRSYCYAFGRDGRFIGNIGRVGQGPGEYTALAGLTIDEKKQSLYLQTMRGVLLEYTWDGVFLRTIHTPTTTYEHGDYRDIVSLSNVFFVRDNLFIGHVRNISGKEKYNFLLFNDSGRVVKSFDNHIQFDVNLPVIGIDNKAIKPISISGNIYVKEIANDTLYCLNENDELVPRFIFDLGKYTLSKEMREITVADVAYLRKSAISINYGSVPMIGFPDYIFFEMHTRNLPGNIPFPQKRVFSGVIPPNAIIIDSHTVFGIYDIVNQKTQLLDVDPFSLERGLINDLDGGLSFWPRYYTSKNELVDIWQAHEMKEMLTEDYFAAHEIKNPQAHQKLKELLKKLDWEDNPVVVIAKLK